MKEVDNAGKRSYHGIKLDDSFQETGEISKYPDRVEKECTIIPYSEESLLFFINLSKGFEKMVHQLAMFFGEQDEANILSFIQNHPKLLRDG